MASSSGPLSEELQCPICLDMFTDPVTTPCGHNFCKICLKECWNNSQDCNCPFCKETFNKRPDLKINRTLRDVVDHFKEKMCPTKPEVWCDACTGKNMKALKSCLNCGASFCKAHLEPHNVVATLKKHKLIDPVENLDDYICQKHERPLELSCRDDQTCVCLSCTEGDHRTHNTVTLEQERAERKAQLTNKQTDVKQMIQDRMKKIQELKMSAEVNKKNTEKEKASSVEFFSALIRSIERCQAELLEILEEKQKAAEKQTEDLIKELEQEITELQKRDSELQQISHTEDHLQLLQIDPSLCSPLLEHTKNWTEISINTRLNVGTLSRALTQLKDTLDEKLIQTDLRRLRQYAVDVTLDPDSAHPRLILSNDGKQVRFGDIRHDVQDIPKRFNQWLSVLGKEGFSSGRFYYEVSMKGKIEWYLGVARESINRKGVIIQNPENGQWTVCLNDQNEFKALDSPPVSLSLRVKPQKVGVFVDYEEGLVSFYDVESSSHIYSYTGQSFTEKLYPYFSPCDNSEGDNSAPLIISTVNNFF